MTVALVLLVLVALAFMFAPSSRTAQETEIRRHAARRQLDVQLYRQEAHLRARRIRQELDRELG